MKPRNKKQKHIVELSGRLRPLTTVQKQWAFSHTIDHYAYRLKSGKAVCMDCGHEWQEVGFGIYRCPNCGDLFSVVAPTLRECRHRRDEWLAKRNK